MLQGYKVVSEDGYSTFYGDKRSDLGDRQYELTSLPWSSTKIDPEKIVFGQQGYHYATSRAQAVEFAAAQDRILLGVEGLPDVQKGGLAVCSQLTVVTARRCFCHPSQLTHPQAIALAASMAELVASRTTGGGVRQAIDAAKAYSTTPTPENAVKALGGAFEAAELWEDAHRSTDERRAVSAAVAAALAAVAAAAPVYKGTHLGSELVSGSETAARRAGLSVVPVALTVGSRVMAATWDCAMATNVTVQTREGMGSDLARTKGFEAGRAIWHQYIQWADILYSGASAEDFMAERRVTSDIVESLGLPHTGDEGR